jgi:hypothetical protein
VAPELPLELRVMTPATVTAQRTTALALANEARMDKASVRRDLRNGALTLAQVAANRPPSLCPMTLFALVLELPGFGSRRLEKLNRRALEDGMNLALTLGGASTRTLRWLVEEVTGQQDVEVALIPRDAEWMDVALALDTLVLEHERCVRDESLPAERWAWADERLHRDHKRVMDRAPVREDDPASGEEQATLRPPPVAERDAGRARP